MYLDFINFNVMHIAIIPDGNRRWALDHHQSITQGYEQGIRAVKEIVKEALQHDVRCMTFFVLSTENAKRDAKWIGVIKAIFHHYFVPFCEEAIQHGCKLRFIGDSQILGDDIHHMILSVADRIPQETKMHLNFCVGYSGRSDMMQAVRRMIEAHADPEEFPKFLSTHGLPDPDIMIRTGGEMRVSNFLLFEMAYTELFFVKKYWPDFTKDDLKMIIQDFKQRERRFGL